MQLSTFVKNGVGNYLAYLFLFYGIFKVAISIVLFTSVIDSNERDAILKVAPFLNIFLTNDSTAAGLLADTAMFVFAIFSVLNALVLFETKLGYYLKNVIHHPYMLAFITYGVGSLILLFYSSILFYISRTKHDDHPWEGGKLFERVHYDNYALYWLMGTMFLTGGIYRSFGGLASTAFVSQSAMLYVFIRNNS